jgi:hypothetical protein
MHIIKIVGLLLVAGSIIPSAIFFPEKGNQSDPKTAVPAFDGVIMTSEDSGKSWHPIQTRLAENFVAASIHTDKNSVYIGGDYGNLYGFHAPTYHCMSKEELLSSFPAITPNDNHRVSGIFSGPSGLYAGVHGVGLFLKRHGASFWQPITIPDYIFHVQEVHEDQDGNLYLVTQYGVYRSQNQGGDWEKIFKDGFTHNLILMDDLLVVNGILGLHVSEDQGRTWTTAQSLGALTGDVKNNYSQIFINDNTWYMLKKMEYSEFGTGTKNQLVYSTDRGQSWEKHPADAFLKQQKDIYSLVPFQGSWYCATREGVFSSSDNGISWHLVLSIPGENPNYVLQVVPVGDQLVCVRTMAGC